jgi:hypothetical protein
MNRTFVPSHDTSSYGAYALSGPEDAYDTYADEERRLAEAAEDMRMLYSVIIGVAGAGFGVAVGSLRASRTGSDLVQSIVGYSLLGGALGYFGSRIYYRAQDSTEDLLSFDAYGR